MGRVSRVFPELELGDNGEDLVQEAERERALPAASRPSNALFNARFHRGYPRR